MKKKKNYAYDLPYPPKGELVEYLLGTKILRRKKRQHFGFSSADDTLLPLSASQTKRATSREAKASPQAQWYLHLVGKILFGGSSNAGSDLTPTCQLFRFEGGETKRLRSMMTKQRMALDMIPPVMLLRTRLTVAILLPTGQMTYVGQNATLSSARRCTCCVIHYRSKHKVPEDHQQVKEHHGLTECERKVPQARENGVKQRREVTHRYTHTSTCELQQQCHHFHEVLRSKTCHSSPLPSHTLPDSHSIRASCTYRSSSRQYSGSHTDVPQYSVRISLGMVPGRNSLTQLGQPGAV